MFWELTQLLETKPIHLLKKVDSEYVKILTTFMEHCKSKQNCLLSQAAALLTSQFHPLIK